ncbi:MAG: hypothetical protein SFW09_19040 [Hyphomicrobiaceae bacterium]|nr:hypothetical protein [Hyphomicrobiaceae bacterium]
MLEARALNMRLLRRTLVGVGLASIGAVVLGAATGLGPLVSAAAALFALAVSVVAVVTNFDVWRAPPAADPSARLRVAVGTLIANAWLGAIAYGWGALAMALLYMKPLTGLWWQHGWQYALAMGLLCVSSVAFASKLHSAAAEGRPHAWTSLARALAAGQGLVAIGGLAFLGLSGKFAAQKADWTANRIFAALALSILAVSIAALVSQARSRSQAG